MPNNARNRDFAEKRGEGVILRQAGGQAGRRIADTGDRKEKRKPKEVKKPTKIEQCANSCWLQSEMYTA